ncbi:MAG TPA: hypothetical protein VKG26_06825 [Bacteroidia bacterium]|nr:hypothetical protein [Bacteroidia bacterium]
MKTAKELHESAMSLYEESLAAKYIGAEEKRITLLKEAFEFEKEAAYLLKDKYDLEPTRSKLFASSATMAYQLSDFRESEKMVAWGLAGSPPLDVLEELRDLFDKVNFYRHLTTKGIELSEDEFRFTLGSGNDMMKGIARGDEVMARIIGIEALYSRTVQRMNKKPYQSAGRVSEEENNIIQLYYKVPEAASFALTFKIPQPKQQPLFPELTAMSPYVDEMLQCIDLINEGKMAELKAKIPDESYFQSFIINARKIAPDGNNIKQVGFTIYRNNVEKVHSFSKIQAEIVLDSIAINTKPEEEKEKEAKRKKETVSGKLLASDSPKKFITVVEEIKLYKLNGTAKKSKFKRHKIKFITEAQKELVRDHYEGDVSVEVWKYHDNSLEFIDLKRS